MTNSNLIPVFNGTIQQSPIQLCNARELHTFLEVGKDFTNWIKDRITDYGFIQDEDYIIVTERTSGRPRKEYHITLDMGKELAMVERNEKGRQVRKYFIECEKRAKTLAPQQMALPEPEKTYTLAFTEYELQRLVWLWCGFKKMNELLGDLIDPLDNIGSRFSGQVYSHHHEYKRNYFDTAPTIKRMIEPFKQSTRLNWTRAINIITQ